MVLVLGSIGFGWAKSGAHYDIPFVTRLAMMWAMPALIFSTLVRAEIDAEAFREIVVATLALYGAFAVVFGAALALAGLNLRTFLPPTVINNSGNLGLPVALFAFGDYGLALSIVLFAVMVTLQFSLGLWFVAGPGRGWEAARQPMVWAGLAGIVIESGRVMILERDEVLEAIGDTGLFLMAVGG